MLTFRSVLGYTPAARRGPRLCALSVVELLAGRICHLSGWVAAVSVIPAFLNGV